MKRLHGNTILVLTLILTSIGTGGCGARAESSQSDARPTEQPPATTQPAPEPTARPTATAVPPTEQPVAAPLATPTTSAVATPSEGPPAGASLGDTWTRPVDGMVMVYVPSGEFEMGSDDPFYNNERPAHSVTLTGFWIDQTEVTNAQYQGCVEAGVCKLPEKAGSYSRPNYYGDSAYDDYPVIHVNWYRAAAYCSWAGGRLPTEEQWEYAARGPDGRRFPWGNVPDGKRLNYCDVNCLLPHADAGSDDGYLDTAPVGSYPAGASWCGALDMVGNAWEWVADWLAFYPSEENPSWLSTQVDRVIRGGGWDTAGGHARCSYRAGFKPASSHDSLGFRCVVPAPDAGSVAQITAPPTPASTIPRPAVADVVASLEGLTLDDFFQESFRQWLLRSPESLTALGIADSFGLRNDQLDDLSDSYVRETQALEAAILDLLRAYDRSQLTPEQQVSYDFYEWWLDNQVRGHEFTYYDYPVHHFINSYHFNLNQLFTEYHPLTNKQDVEDYITRLSRVDDQVEQLIAGLKLREEAGVMPPRFILELTKREMLAYLQMRSPDPAAVNGELLPVYTVLDEALAELEGLSAADRLAFRGAALREIEESFIPAYVDLLDYLDYLLPVATNDAGVCRLPRGDEYYAYMLRQETSTDLTPAEIHELGLAEVARIQEEMRALFDELGYPQDASLRELMNRAVDDGGYYDIRTQEGKDRFVAAIEALIEKTDHSLHEVFDLYPSREVVVVAGSTGGYYVSGTADGSRPGAYHVSVMGSWRPKYYVPTATYHETIPGHHLQVALAQELDLPMFRNEIILNGYAEGWALYAERLAWELGFYDDDPYGNFGRLYLELLRAARLVTDTGIHAMCWTHEEARAYMEEVVPGWSHEVERYVVLPAQATGYKVGMIKMLELRQRAMDRLGDQFDLKEFHNVVLGNGSVPLDILERVVQDYIDAKLDTSAAPAPSPASQGGDSGQIALSPRRDDSAEIYTREADGMAMVYVPSGTFLMGSLPTDAGRYDNELPQHEVTVDAFWLDRTEVTNAQYRLCVDAGACVLLAETGSHTRDSYYDNGTYDDFPVIHVSWYQAAAYCHWAGARLPQEQEWAYAARGPDTRIYSWGNEFDGSRLNYCDANCARPFPDQTTDDGYADTAPVGNYPSGASWVGALDMLGNVWEWVHDWHEYYPGHPSHEHTSSFPAYTYRVLRGGAWDTNRGHARNAFRNWFVPAAAGDSIGFRCARDHIPTEKYQTPGEYMELITVNGVKRWFTVHIPPGYRPGVPMPLVVNLHAYSSDAVQQEQLTHMNAKADEEGFVVVNPQALGDPPSWWGPIPGPTGQADMDFFAELLPYLQREISIDPARIYATGMSNGATMTYRLGCDMSDTFAAIAPVAGGHVAHDLCQIERPVAVLVIQGTRDSVIPYYGSGTDSPPVRVWLEAWAQHNGCDLTPHVTHPYPTVTREIWRDCDENVVVALYTREGGGHIWPGSRLGEGREGSASEFDATDLVWDFFEAHPRDTQPTVQPTATPALPTAAPPSTATPTATVQATPVSGYDGPGRYLDVMITGGGVRWFMLYIPPTYQPGTPTPLVLSFHGAGSDHRAQEFLTAMSARADEAGFIVVYPKALGSTSVWYFGSGLGGDIDLIFTRDLIDYLESQLSIDPARIYATGMSNGAGLVDWLGCNLADKIAAIAPVAGAYAYGEACEPARPVPVVAFHGTADTVVPYEGMGGSVPTWAATWAERNRCDLTPTVTYQQGDVTAETWGHCDADAIVTLYTVAGGDHTWPGSQFGSATQEVIASDVIWEFFENHPMP